MTNTQILTELDRTIARLNKLRASLNGFTAKKGKSAVRRKGTMSPEGRARIVAAQKKRWAKVKRGK